MVHYLCSLFCLLLLFTDVLAAPFTAAHGSGDDSLPFWNLPVELDDTLIDVRFAVDSTWHLVEGRTKLSTGKVWLDRPDDYRSIRATLSLPISEFVTGNSSRDSRMREVMHSDKFPQVEIRILRVSDICNPTDLKAERLKAESSCPAKLEGELTISGVVREVEIPATVARQGDDYRVKGKTSLRWADYNVEDPSILIAKLQPVVDITFDLKLPHRDISH